MSSLALSVEYVMVLALWAAGEIMASLCNGGAHTVKAVEDYIHLWRLAQSP
jgi:hypothetical protein